MPKTNSTRYPTFFNKSNMTLKTLPGRHRFRLAEKCPATDWDQKCSLLGIEFEEKLHREKICNDHSAVKYST